MFVDKTGTLTRNVMELMMCSVKGKMFNLVEQNHLGEQEVKKLLFVFISYCFRISSFIVLTNF